MGRIQYGYAVMVILLSNTLIMSWVHTNDPNNFVICYLSSALFILLFKMPVWNDCSPVS